MNRTEAEKKKIQILYEDADLMVCVKPAGIASQTKKTGQQDIVSLLRNYRHEKGEEPYIGLVHRLDQPVEGILVLGKQEMSTAQLSRQLAQGSFSKVYLAVTVGAMPLREGKLEDYLKKDGRRNLSAVVEKGEPQAKKAQLLYQVLQTDDIYHPVRNLVRVQLLTGRHHQIRVQLAHHGTPLAGDTKYGMTPRLSEMAMDEDAVCKEWTGTDRKTKKDEGLGLCACELEFVHPVNKNRMKFEILPSQPVFQPFRSFMQSGS